MYQRIEYLFFFNREGSFKPFVFFRIAIGSLILIHFLTIIGDIGLLFGPGGILPTEVTELYIDPLVLTRNKLINLFHLRYATFNLLFNSAYILFACFIIAGLFTRLSALIMLLLNVALIKSNVFFAYGVDFFTGMSLFYLVLLPSNRKFSIDSLLFKKTEPSPDQYLFYQRCIQLHLCLAYSFSGLNKILGFNWRNGESIWKSINLPYANMDFHIPVDWLAGYPFLLTVLGWGVVILELMYPVILFKTVRKKWLYAVISMHLGIALIINLYFFSAIMIIWNITAFYNFETKRL